MKLVDKKYYCSTWDFTLNIVFYESHKVLKKHMKKKYHIGIPDEIDMNEVNGMAWYSDATREHFMFVRKGAHIGVLVHESVHVAQVVLQQSRIYDTVSDPNFQHHAVMEAEAYLIESLFLEVNGRIGHLVNKNQTHITVQQRIKKS